jgi:hypothetical protein
MSRPECLESCLRLPGKNACASFEVKEAAVFQGPARGSSTPASALLVNARSFIILILCGLGLAVQGGCQRQEETSRYRVLKPEVLAEINRHQRSARKPDAPPPAAKDRILAAIVPHGPNLWFFKIAGPKDAVAEQSEDFLRFVKSVRFAAAPDEKPQWTAPHGWREQPASKMRYATFEIASAEPPLELTVTILARRPDDEDDGVLANVNRWRGQLRLRPISRFDLDDETTQVELEGTTAMLVDFVGELVVKTMGQAPFSHGGQ